MTRGHMLLIIAATIVVFGLVFYPRPYPKWMHIGPKYEDNLNPNVD